jgi:hypothetical protein
VHADGAQLASGKLTCAHGGFGFATHLSGEVFKMIERDAPSAQLADARQEPADLVRVLAK